MKLAEFSIETEKLAPSAWRVFAIASIAIFMASLDSTILYAGFNNILQSFPNSKASDLSWAMSGYSIVYAAMMIPAGGIADKYGRKKMFMLGTLLFISASFACGVSPSVFWLIVARVFQSIGACLLSPAALALVLEAFPKEKRMIAMGAWGAVGALAAALGPGIGSYIIDVGGWEWAFFINIPIGLFCIWQSATILHESVQPRDKMRLDLLGMLQLILGVGAIAYGIVEMKSADWSQAELVGIIVLGLVIILSYIPWAKYNPEPLFDLGLFKNKTFLFSNLAGIAFGIAFSIMFFSFFFWMKNIWHFSQSLAGAAIMPGPLVVVPTAILSGKIASKIGHRPLLITGAITYALSGLWFLLVPDASPNYARDWLPGLLLSGMSVGLVMPSLSAAAVFGLPPKDYAVGSAINQAMRQIGTVIGVSITVLFLAKSQLQIADFKPTYLIHIALALMTAILCIPINTHPKQSAKTKS
ncbi:DHA2 family efflux MFS transporter permease subunit [Methylotenera versatilis]|uniref:Drug resistance transporter, EmrB/QacA subfamily n=1 Tax=Methylotenera versatilis (strain 301) TaxID=666681 RepID=D7DKI6_METV0|nr:DHA2 family efflux MFS transporter permease subunit [Methylotenera versatilis]ADI30432.1 drug resistance transporter, EmrB/QacA subfamily [Methylotenera versatilis 301]